LINAGCVVNATYSEIEPQEIANYKSPKVSLQSQGQ